MLNRILLSSAAAIVVVAGAQAADLPSKKAAPATYVKVCDAKGAGFFFVPGTETCMKIGGYVRVEYDYRGAEATGGTYTAPATNTLATSHGLATSGWYQRGVISVDARTPTAYGDVRAYIQTRIQAGSGTMHQTEASSLEAAYIQFAGFTFGQASQPYSFMSSWGYMSNWWTGWPNGVRQLSYTAVLGGGLSATVSVQDANGNASGWKVADDASPQAWDKNGPIYVGNVRWDQSWGSLQAMGAYTTDQPALDTGTLSAENGSGYAVGMGLKLNLPMLGAGDTLEFTANYWDGLVKAGIGNTSLATPSSGSWGPVNPLTATGGSDTKFASVTNSSGWAVGAQLQHYWSKDWRTVIMGAYADMDNPVFSSGSKSSDNSLQAKSLGAMMIWSPSANFDIGLHAQYVRWDGKNTATSAKYHDDNIGYKLRVERRF